MQLVEKWSAFSLHRRELDSLCRWVHPALKSGCVVVQGGAKVGKSRLLDAFARELPQAIGVARIRLGATLGGEASAPSELLDSGAQVWIVDDAHLASAAEREALLCLAEKLVAGDRTGFLLLASEPSAWPTLLEAQHLILGALDHEAIARVLQDPTVVAFFAESTRGDPATLHRFLSTPLHDQLLERRIDRAASQLSPAARRVLDTLAVAGRELPLASLERLLPGVELGGPIQELAALTKRTFARGELHLSLETELTAEVYRQIEDATRAQLHIAVGMDLEHASGASARPQVADHLLRGGAGELGVNAALEAAESLADAGDVPSAIEFFLRASRATSRAEVRDRVDQRVAELGRRNGNFPLALEHAERLRARVPSTDNTLRSAELHLQLDQHQRVLDLCRPIPGPKSIALQAEALRWLGRSAEAEDLLETAAGELETGSADWQELRRTHGKLRLQQSDYRGAREIFAESLQLARQNSDLDPIFSGELNLGICALMLGERALAERHYAHALDIAERLGDMHKQSYCLQNLGVLCHWRAEYGRALDYFQRAAALFRRIGQRGRLAWLAIDLASVHLDLGDLDRAAMWLELGKQFAAENEPENLALNRIHLEGRVFLARKDLLQARERFRTAAERANQSADLDRRVRAEIELCRLDLAEGRRTRLPEDSPSKTTSADRQVCGAEIALHERDLPRARTHLNEALRRFTELGSPEGQLSALVLLCETAQLSADELGLRRWIERANQVERAILRSVPKSLAGGMALHPSRARLRRLDQAEAKAAPGIVQSSVGYPRLLGRHPRLLQVLAVLDKVAPTHSTVLIRGESGTGKELVAEALHSNSPRRQKPFIKVNCAALVESLLLSELFGHERGAFTGALKRKVGLFEAADGGTLFLDEIGDISPQTQAALLRVLQEKEFERVGSTTPIRVDVRIVCATHRSLEQMVADGTFREDLYYRLCGIQVMLPALRERPEDLPILCEHFLRRMAEERGVQPKRLNPDAVALLERHSWPGNVRELENVLRSVSLLCDRSEISAADFAEYAELKPRARVLKEEEAPSEWARLLREGLSLKELKTQVEIECIREALRSAAGNITHAAERLGMKRPRLSQLVKQHRRLLGDNFVDEAPETEQNGVEK
jgi:DNA-binding NtrC family response regulator/tetratricopeptide (TPR) repeat protein